MMIFRKLKIKKTLIINKINFSKLIKNNLHFFKINYQKLQVNNNKIRMEIV